jgi:hypothetical protein
MVMSSSSSDMLTMGRQAALDASCQILSATDCAVPPQGLKVALAAARFPTIVKRLSSASARPTEIPHVRARRRFPTDKTAFPGTWRHTC